jgi:4-hydroxy-3-polyprenylbenzoate decarboxylase
MPYRNLADFLEDLGRAGELAAVDAEVDPCLEIAEVTRRIARQNGPALLFRNVKGHDIPLVTNLFGTESRILRALGADSIEEATVRIDRALNGGGNEGWLERLRFGGKGGAAASFTANKVKAGACQQVVQIGSDVNLLELPLLVSGEGEKARVVNAAVIISIDPETRAQVFLRGDLHVTDRDAAIIVWSDLGEPSRLTEAYRKLDAKMPVAIVIGGDPSMQLAAAAPLPLTVDPLGVAGLLRERPLEAVPCRSIDVAVPAESDSVIEGFIDPIPKYVLSTDRPDITLAQNVEVAAVTHRTNRVVPVAISEIECNDFWLMKRFMARLFLPYLKQTLRELIDFDLPLSGRARHTAILAIEKTYRGQARHVATVAWGMRPFQFAKLLVVVDADVNVRDTDCVFAAIARETHFKEDIWELAGPCDPIDASASWGLLSQHMAIDATREITGEPGSSPDTLANSSERVVELVTDRWAEYGLGPEEDE